MHVTESHNLTPDKMQCCRPSRDCLVDFAVKGLTIKVL